MDAIASLPLMDDFQLAVNGVDAAIPLDRLSGLRKCVVRGALAPSVLGSLAHVIGHSPYLSHLVILPNSSSVFSESCIPFSKIPSAISLPLRHLTVRASQIDLNPIRHITGLNSLSLEDHDIGRDTNVYPDFLQERLFCSRLVVQHVHPTWLNYLSQYSGLQELSVLIRDPANPFSDQLARQFWATVLPKHAATLQVLNIYSKGAGGWCSSDEAILAIMQCRQLRSLTLSVDPRLTDHVQLFDDGHFEHDYNQYTFDKIVGLLIFVENIISDHMHSGFFYHGPVT